MCVARARRRHIRPRKGAVTGLVKTPPSTTWRSRAPANVVGPGLRVCLGSPATLATTAALTPTTVTRYQTAITDAATVIERYAVRPSGEAAIADANNSSASVRPATARPLWSATPSSSSMITQTLIVLWYATHTREIHIIRLAWGHRHRMIVKVELLRASVCLEQGSPVLLKLTSLQIVAWCLR